MHCWMQSCVHCVNAFTLCFFRQHTTHVRSPTQCWKSQESFVEKRDINCHTIDVTDPGGARNSKPHAPHFHQSSPTTDVMFREGACINWLVWVQHPWQKYPLAQIQNRHASARDMFSSTSGAASLTEVSFGADPLGRTGAQVAGPSIKKLYGVTWLWHRVLHHVKCIIDCLWTNLWLHSCQQSIARSWQPSQK